MPKSLWIAMLGGVTAWAGHLLVSYLLADLGCRGDTWSLLAGRHIVTLAAAVAVIGVTVGVRPLLARHVSVTETTSSTASVTQGVASEAPEPRFLARVSLVLNAIFLLAIVMAGTTSLFLAPCM